MNIVKEIPENHNPDKFTNERGFFNVMCFGFAYYIPITDTFIKTLKLKQVDGQIQITFRKEKQIEDFLRLVILSIQSTIEVQLADKVYNKLNGNIERGLETMYEKILKNAITEGFTNKMLPEPENEK